MIIDQLSNASTYHALGERIADGLRFLANTDLSGLAPGKHEIQGSDLYVNVMDYQTKPAEECTWEAHRAYIDIQVVANGSERIGYADTEELSVAEPYNESADYMLLAGEGDFLTCGLELLPYSIRRMPICPRLQWPIRRT